MNPTIHAYDDAFRIVQQAIFRRDSATGIGFLTRFALCLLRQGRRELLSITNE